MGLLENAAVRQLYRQLLREAERFPQYNYRQYAMRRIRDEFERRKDMEASKIPELLAKGRGELERLRRMTSVASLYAHDKLIIEGDASKEDLGKDDEPKDGEKGATRERQKEND